MLDLSDTLAELEKIQADGVAPVEEAAPVPEVHDQKPLPPPIQEPGEDAPPIAAEEEKKEEARKEEQKPQYSKQFQELARRERNIRNKQQEAKSLEGQVAELRAKLEARPGLSREALKEEARKDPVKFIEDHGLSYKELTETILNEGKAPESMELKDKYKQLESKLTKLEDTHRGERDKAEAEAKQTSYNNFLAEIETFVDNNKDDFELVHIQGQKELVGDVIREHYSTTGKVMPYHQACGLVEDHLEKAVRSSMAARKFNTGKTPETPVATSEAQASQDSSKPNTLTNSNTASPAGAAEGTPPRLETAEQSLEALSKLDFWAPME